MSAKPAVEPQLSVEEVAEILGVSHNVVLRLAMHGELTACRIGRALRFEAASVQAFLAAHRLSVRGDP